MNHVGLLERGDGLAAGGGQETGSRRSGGSLHHPFRQDRSGTGQVSNANEYPDWNRTNTWGGLFLLSVAGEAGGLALTAVSLGRANNPTSIGGLYLDIPTLFIPSADTIPPSGVLRHSYLVPASPALMGVTLYFQSAIVAPSSTYLADFAPATVF